MNQTTRLVLSALLIMSLTFPSYSQEYTVERYSYFSLSCLQTKESANTGLVFTGPGVDFGMNWDFTKENRKLSYEFELGAGIPFSKGMPGLEFYLKPVDLAWMFRLRAGENGLWLGPMLRSEYTYNYYPELQSGFDYWFTDYSLGVNGEYGISAGKSTLRLKLNTTLLGFASRQPSYRDPYFYDIGVNYAFAHLHENLMFGSLNLYNVTEFGITWRPLGSRLSYGYSVKYTGYYGDPRLTMLDHTLTLVINTKNR